jgi:hypothetical protein
VANYSPVKHATSRFYSSVKHAIFISIYAKYQFDNILAICMKFYIMVKLEIQNIEMKINKCLK